MEPKTFNISLTVDQLNVVMAGLSELPFKTSNNLVQLIVSQFNAQDKAEPGTDKLVS